MLNQPPLIALLTEGDFLHIFFLLSMDCGEQGGRGGAWGGEGVEGVGCGMESVGWRRVWRVWGGVV